jgi:hypothetical protein
MHWRELSSLSLVLLFSSTSRLRRDALAGAYEQSQQSGERAKNEMKRSE